MSSQDTATAQALAELAKAQAQFASDLSRRLGAGHNFLLREWIERQSAALIADQGRLRAVQEQFYRDQLALWRRFMQPDEPAEHGAPRSADDPRFSAPEWRTLPWFAYLREAHRLMQTWLEALADTIAPEPLANRRMRFLARQWADAMAPSNGAATNPEAIRLAFATGGASLARGLELLRDDLRRGRIRMTDESRFEVGRNLAVTAGAVVYRNALIELLQYHPTTAQVHARPLLIVPPCINKFYILDLRPENSFVRYALSLGLSVFMISWRDIPPELDRTTWDDYLNDGVMRALEVVRAICTVPELNAVGFCVGGTMLACAVAVLRRKRRRSVGALTLLASLLDFTDPGEIACYVDEPYVRRIEASFSAGGLISGRQLAEAFASLRANDLIWRYVVNNYLKGQTPPAFDLLYWNCDSANLAGPMYAYYLRHMYLENALRDPDRLRMCGVPVDLGRITQPAYCLATADDHIVPWHSAFASARLLGGETQFVLGASGHIAGVINPATANRRSYRTGPMAATSEQWLARATEHAGSWWPHWGRWITARSGKRVPARTTLGSADYPVLDPAPGRYVRGSADEPTERRDERASNPRAAYE